MEILTVPETISLLPPQPLRNCSRPYPRPVMPQDYSEAVTYFVVLRGWAGYRILSVVSLLMSAALTAENSRVTSLRTGIRVQSYVKMQISRLSFASRADNTVAQPILIPNART